MMHLYPSSVGCVILGKLPSLSVFQVKTNRLTHPTLKFLAALTSSGSFQSPDPTRCQLRRWLKLYISELVSR